MQVDTNSLSIAGGALKIARLEHERYIDVEDPAALIEQVQKSKPAADIFTFFQRLPESKPKFTDYYMEYESIAALPIRSYDYWLERQIPKQTRTSLKKSQKQGVIVRPSAFDDDYIEGMTGILNESPIRQGRPNWHYGKNFDTVKKEFAKYAFREEHIGAYYNDEMIGFLFLAHAGRYAIPIQIVSKIAHQDKKPNNALMAKAVELCAEKKIPWLVYGKWARGPRNEFKVHNGFENVILPRYYVPLSLKGAIALKLHLHHGLAGLLPEAAILRLMGIRQKFYASRYKNAAHYGTAKND
jgi:hypothetical protein